MKRPLTWPSRRSPGSPASFFVPWNRPQHPKTVRKRPRKPGRGPQSDMVPEVLRSRVDSLYRAESRRILATLIRLLGDFDLAEDALHDAFSAALEQWPRDGVPANPRAWLVSAGRFKAIDALRRRARFDASLGMLAERLDTAASEDP